MFSSLSIANFRTYFVGVTASNIGSWMARTGQSWLVLMVLTDQSSTALGAVNSFMFLPSLVLAPLAGSLADRFPKYKIMLAGQVVMGLDAIILSTLVFTGNVQLWHVYMFAFIDGAAGAFDQPARAAFVSEIVGNQKLPNAISLNSASFNAARALGPGIAGVVIAVFDTGVVFAVDALSFITMIVALLALDKKLLEPAPVQTREQASIIGGFRYLARRPDLMVLVFIGLAVGGFGFNFIISNAVMATQEFGRGSGEYGILGSMMGIGAVLAAMTSAWVGGFRIRFILLGMGVYTVFSAVAAFSPSYWLFAGLQVPIGFAVIMSLLGANALLQTHTAPEFRGRVLAVWGITLTGIAPVVSPTVGWLGDAVGPYSTVLFGAICVGIALVIVTALIMKNHQIKLRLVTNQFPPKLEAVFGPPSIGYGEPKR
ncbi:MAG: MFS transporter [Propionibacteriaceae bacterium]|jgi:MFS family permease|nr:MFS transporter [Propionibacteriaceae bacterium]